MMLALRRQISPALVVGGFLVLLCALFGEAVSQMNEETRSLLRLRAERDVLSHVDILRQTVLEAETGQRGFLLTGKQAYLAPYLAAVLSLPSTLDALSGELAGTGQARALTAAVDAKFDELRQTLDILARSGLDPALAIVRTDRGSRLTSRIFAILDQVKADRDRDLALEPRKADRTRDRLVLLTGGSVAMALSCVAVGLAQLRRSARRLAASEARFRLLADHTSDMIVRLDLDLAQVFVSPSCLGVCGFAPAELLGRSPLDFVHPDDRHSLERQFQRVREGRTGTELMTFRTAHRDGHHVWVEVAVSLARDPQGRPEALIASVRDVTSRKLQADELRIVNLELERLARHLGRARDRAERANTAKTRFLAGMSHELRTPLNGIVGYAHLLRLEGGLTADQSARVAGMLDAGEHLLGMISHVLELSEIEAEHVDLRRQDVALEALARSCLALVRPSADLKRLALSCEPEPAAARAISTDAARLRQVLLNLLGNAVKFTGAGHVALRIRPGSDHGHVRLEVADTGPGIQADEIERVFDEFERVGADAAVEGAGLGLAISARLVKLMGGRIGHQDNPGGGSVFYVELPVGDLAGTAAEPGLLPPGSSQRLRVMVVDDVAMNRDIALAFLQAAGHEAVPIEGGREAVERAADDRFDVILMDVRMPDIDGLEATRRIRALAGAAATVPIVALTAQAFAEQIEECRAAGMTGHLAKPFAPDQLLAAVQTAAGADPVPHQDDPSPPLLDEAAFRATATYLEPAVTSSYLDIIEERAATLLGALRVPRQDDAAAAAAHEFAGSAGLFGFMRASELARCYERALRTVSPDAARLGGLLSRALEDTLPPLHDRRHALATDQRPVV